MTNTYKKDIQSISNKDINSKENIIININEDIFINENNPNMHLSPKSMKERNIEEENVIYKKSSTYNIGEGVTVITINNFNDNQNINNKIPVKKSKTRNEENINRLNLGYHFNHNGPNHLGTVLETINEVSNSKVDSSDLSDDDDNINNKNSNNINNCIENNKKNETNSEAKKNGSTSLTPSPTKNTLH